MSLAVLERFLGELSMPLTTWKPSDISSLNRGPALAANRAYALWVDKRLQYETQLLAVARDPHLSDEGRAAKSREVAAEFLQSMTRHVRQADAALKAKRGEILAAAEKRRIASIEKLMDRADARELREVLRGMPLEQVRQLVVDELSKADPSSGVRQALALADPTTRTLLLQQWAIDQSLYDAGSSTEAFVTPDEAETLTEVDAVTQFVAEAATRLRWTADELGGSLDLNDAALARAIYVGLGDEAPALPADAALTDAPADAAEPAEVPPS